MVTLLDLPVSPVEIWTVPMPTYDLTRHVTPGDAQAMLRALQHWIANEATRHGADPLEARDAAASLEDLDAFLADLASRRRIST